MLVHFTFYQLCHLFFLYAFLGWCTEVCYAALMQGHFTNRGFLNGPLCPIYGFGVLLVVICLSPLQENLFILFLGSVVLTTLLEYLTGLILEKCCHAKWWDYSDKPYNLHGYICLQFSLIWGLACLIVVRMLHPLLFQLVELIPHVLGIVLLGIAFAALSVDLAATISTVYQMNKQLKRITELAANIHAVSDKIGTELCEGTLTVKKRSEDAKVRLDTTKQELDERIDGMRDAWDERLDERMGSPRRELAEQRAKLTAALKERHWGLERMLNAFPTLRHHTHQGALEQLRRSRNGAALAEETLSEEILQHTAEETTPQPPVFAQGYNLAKMIWVFLISSFLGDLIETLFVWATTGRLVSRSSVLYGPFSVVWGLGAVLLTVALHRLIGKPDRSIFIAGMLIGGAYEYICSLFTEYVFGTTFWDYSDIPFNLNGRINLLFCFFWGIIALVWLKGLYPRFSRWIERIPIPVGRVLTVVLAAAMVVNMSLTALALTRYVQRQEDLPATNGIERFLDQHYDDTQMEWLYPGMNQVSHS